MILINPPLKVKTADQCFWPIMPTNKNRDSPCVRAGTRSRSGSSQSRCASTKSTPCFRLLAALLFGSNSKSMVFTLYLHHTGCQPMALSEERITVSGTCIPKQLAEGSVEVKGDASRGDFTQNPQQASECRVPADPHGFTGPPRPWIHGRRNAHSLRTFTLVLSLRFHRTAVRGSTGEVSE